MAQNRISYSINDTERKPAVLPDTPAVKKMTTGLRKRCENEPNEKIIVSKMRQPALMPLFENPTNNGIETKHTAKKCFCTECRKVFDMQKELTAGTDDSLRPCLLSPDKIRITSESIDNSDLSCPECGLTAADNDTRIIPVKLNDKGTEWHLPEFIRGGWSFETRDKTTQMPIKYEANILTQNTIVYAKSGKAFHMMNEYSEITDLVNNDVRVTKRQSLPAKSGEKPQYNQKATIMASVDPYQKNIRPDNDNIMNYSMQTVRTTISTHKGNIYNDTYNPILHKLFGGKKVTCPVPLYAFIRNAGSWTQTDYETSPLLSSSGVSAWYNENMMAKREFIADKFRKEGKIDPLFVDWNKNGLFLQEHHPGSTEENTNIDAHLQDQYISLMLRYPVAFEYVCERTQDALTDEYYNKKRRYESIMRSDNEEAKALAKPAVEPKDMPDSVKCKHFREQMKYVAHQLAVVDNKVLTAIHESKTLDDMKAKLQFFAFGDNNTKKNSLQNAQTPSQIKSVKEKDGQYENAFDATNQLAQMFRKNPIGVANTCYTCHKIGIKDSALLKTVLEYADKESPSNPGQGNYKYTANAGTIMPVQDAKTLRFLRSYVKNYSPENLLGQRRVVTDILTNEDNHQYFVDSVNMYDQIMNNKNIIVNIESDATEEMRSASEEQTKTRLKMYLTQQPTSPPEQAVKNAYRDFAAEGLSKDDIDEMCRTIKEESALNKIHKYYAENGEDATLKHPQIAEFLKQLEADGITTDKGKISAINAYVPTNRRKVHIGTKDKKPLFANRPLHAESGSWNEHGLHDELSAIVSKIVDENEDIEYDDREKKLEGSYPASPNTPNIKYSFHLMKDKYDFIRTATELSNCVAGGMYFNNASKENHDNRTYCMYMADDNMNKVACIEIGQRKVVDPNDSNMMKTQYSIKQMQSYNDKSLPEEYAYAAVEWMNDHDMVSNTPNTATFAKVNDNGKFELLDSIQKKAFYGNGNVDFHCKEVDEVTATVVHKDKMKEIREKRAQAAAKMYPDGIPEPPEDIIGSLEFKLDKHTNTETLSCNGDVWTAPFIYDETKVKEEAVLIP